MDNGVPRAAHTMAIVGSAGISAGSVRLDGSLDGTNWFQLIVATAAAASAVTPASVGNTPARFVRATIAVAVVGGTVAVSIASA
jgi:hypothetical protein